MLPPFGAQITKSGCSIFGATSVRFGGGAVLEKRAVPAVTNRNPGAFNTRSKPWNSSSLLAELARARALGDDGGELVGLGCGLEHQLAADGEAEAADPARVDVRPRLQELDRGEDVLVAAPAEQVAVAFALALAAAVEEQDAVAVAHEHPGVRLRAAAAGEGDHGRAVLRGHVPALELEAVARPERDVLVRGAEVGCGHGLPHDVGDHVAESERRDRRVRQDAVRRR